MQVRLLAYGLVLSIWIAAASWAVAWAWPLAALISFFAGRMLANAAQTYRTHVYLSVLSFSAGLMVVMLAMPVGGSATLMSHIALVHVGASLAAFSLVRHVASQGHR